MNIFKSTLLIFTIFFSFTVHISAQNEQASCGTVTSSESLNYFNSIKPQLKKYEETFMQMRSSKSTSKTRTINSIPIKAHVIRASNGTGGICDADLNNAISELNTVFAGAFMEFFLCDGINYINEDALYHFKKGDEKSLKETYFVPGLINIYFTDFIENGLDESICGYTDNEGRNDAIVMKNSCVTNDSSLVHELGHFFSLIHTHGVDNIKLTTEFVDGSNCDTDGDGICDTPADPKLTTKNVNNFCEYIGTERDAHGDYFTPDATNIMSYSRKGCRNHFTPQQLARMHAFYLVAKNYLACPSFNANFTVDANQTCESSLTVNFESNCTNVTKWQWDMDSDGIIDYTTQNPTHTFESGIYDVTLTVSNDKKTIKKTFFDFIKVGTEPNWLQEDFDTFKTVGDNGWTATDVTQNGYNWLSNSGKTPSDTTGPLTDSSSKTGLGTYIYAEASGAKPGDVAEFVSPCITINYENSELEFAYHMFGKNIGELHVDIKTEDGYINDVVPALIGNQQKNQSDAFLTKDINLSSYYNRTINVRFRAIRGAGWDGDIAIDAVSIKTIITPITDKDVIAYPNPIKNDLLYVKSNKGDEALNFEISNLAGQLCLSGIITNEPINTSKLVSGMYLLTISSNNSKVTKKLIK
ncbi:T9SS type A sorting domain-containing protein [Mariniflexile sp.]|uniref:T9SS type A sorting domain-containing protein n=2 Tax=Mariniflexile sp. TaxID=1979402 RepID=UPI0040483DF0